MMLTFWMGIILLLLMALAFVLLPLLRTRIISVPSTKIENIAIYHQNLAEMETQVDPLQADNQQQIQTESQINLLDDLSDQTKSQTKQDIVHIKPDWITALLLLICVTGFSLVFYWHYGNNLKLRNWQRQKHTAIAVQQLRAELGSPQRVIAALQQHLKQNPQSAHGWYLLGRLYLTQHEFQKATQAFEKAYMLQPNDPETIFQYAQALYLVHHSLRGKPTQLLKQLQQLQPDNDMVINLLAVAAFDQKKYQQAIQYWEQLLPRYSADSADGQAILSAIARAQTALANQSPKEKQDSPSKVLK